MAGHNNQDLYPEAGQEVIWQEQRKWGGKQNSPVIFLRRVGLFSARIRISEGVFKTVRLWNLTWERKESQS